MVAATLSRGHQYVRCCRFQAAPRRAARRLASAGGSGAAAALRAQGRGQISALIRCSSPPWGVGVRPRHVCTRPAARRRCAHAAARRSPHRPPASALRLCVGRCRCPPPPLTVAAPSARSCLDRVHHGVAGPNTLLLEAYTARYTPFLNRTAQRSCRASPDLSSRRAVTRLPLYQPANDSIHRYRF
jgi:hypothetical protein